MLELLAQVEPMSLPVWAVLVLSAAMYPLGFMLGAPCSECCGEGCGPCSRCTHYADNGGSCNFTNIYTNLSYTVAGIGSEEIANPGTEPSSGCGDNSLSIPEEDWPDVGIEYLSTPCIYPGELLASETADDCGCTVCRALLSFSVSMFFGDDAVLRLGKEFQIVVGDCSQTSVEFDTADPGHGDWGINEDSVGGTAAQEWIDYLNTLSITGALSIPACDCGACCDDGCEENVAEGGCTSWQGVGTDCDPDPC